jgi:hypothetical protein
MFKFKTLNSKTFNLHLQFELKELKRRQEEEERKRQEELAAKQTPPPSSPEDQPSERYMELLFIFLSPPFFILFWGKVVRDVSKGKYTG